MNASSSTMARQIAQSVSAFEQRLKGRAPESVTVVLSEDTLVITLHGALSPAEKALAKNPSGAAQIQEFHRQLYASTAASLHEEIQRITGVELREAAAEIEPAQGPAMQIFADGTVVQVFLLARSMPAGTWSGSGRSEPS
ncbi:MAG: DUF2294 domain-containing protein [Planctomycetia bacterium]|nr:DUF2294 domain-containing protein [Planctomycetia bacterium]